MLPEIIQKAAVACNLPVPGQAVPLPSNCLAGRFAAQQPSHRDTVWPPFLAVSLFLAGSSSELLKLKVPVSTYAPITKVEGLMVHGFPTVPSLELNLSFVFGVRVA